MPEVTGLLPTLRVSMLEQLPTPVLAIDRSGALLDANPAAEHLIAASGSDALARLCARLVPLLAEDAASTSLSFSHTFGSASAAAVYQCTAAHLRGPDGNLLGATVCLHRLPAGEMPAGDSLPPAQPDIDRREEEAALFKIGVAITSGLQLKNVLQSILDECRAVLPVDILYIALYDRSSETYHFPLVWDDGSYRSQEEPVSVRRQRTLTSAIISSSQTLNIGNLYDPAVVGQFEWLMVADAPTRSYLGVPLLIHGKVIGVLSIQHLHSDMYTADHVRLLEMIATQAAVAVENARLYEAAQAELVERQRIERALVESEERLRMAAQLAQIGIWDREASAGRLIWDDRMCAIHGVPADETVSPMSWRELIHPDDRLRIQEVVEAAVAGGRQIQLDYRIVRPDGAVRHLLTIGGAILDEHGDLVRQLGVCMDITERKQTEEALRTSEQRYQLLIANVSDVIWMTDSQGILTYVSPSVRRQVGYAAEDLIGRSFEQWLAPSSVESVRASLQAALAKTTLESFDEPVRTEFEVLRKDGTLRTVESLSVPRRDAAGQFIGFQGTSRDITELRRTEQALTASLTKYAAVFDVAPIGISITDGAGQIVESNREAERILGISHQLQLERTLDAPEWRLIRPDGEPMPASEYASVRAFTDNRRVDNVEMGVVKEDGAITWISVNAAPIPLSGYGIAVAYVDITERRMLENALRSANEDLEQRVAERTAALSEAVAGLQRANAGKDAFLAAASHELRTPLVGVLSLAEMLQSQIKGELNDHQRHFVEGIQLSGERLLELINNVLNYAQAMSDNAPVAPEVCRLQELCAVSVRAVKAKAANKEQHIDVDVSPADLAIYSDSRGIIQILNTLLGNAVKFTPRLGRIGVTARAIEGGSAVELVVWDTGIGIAEEQMTHLFRPFTQLDQGLRREYTGIGLGLAYVGRKVAILGGAIRVISVVGEGSRFIVTLPNAPVRRLPG